MTTIMLAVLRFPPVLHTIRIGIGSVAEWLLVQLLGYLPWHNNHVFMLNGIVAVAELLFGLYLLKLILLELRHLTKWLKDWWNGINDDTDTGILG
jgi:hypothetical protein